MATMSKVFRSSDERETYHRGRIKADEDPLIGLEASPPSFQQLTTTEDRSYFSRQ